LALELPDNVTSVVEEFSELSGGEREVDDSASGELRERDNSLLEADVSKVNISDCELMETSPVKLDRL